MPRDRSRSPRRKERRRSRSRERERRPDESEKRLDKFGRDVTSRPAERYSSSRGFREEPLRRKEEPRDNRRDGRSNRDDEKRFDRNSVNQDNYPGEYEDGRMDSGSNPYYADARQTTKEKIDSQDDEVDEETRKMQQLMGIGGFDTTKNKKVANNVGGYAKVNKTQKYRQYMNRRGGFNRPLDYVQ